MTTWLLQAVFYAMLASLVIVVNRHRPLTRLAGAALLAFTLISSASFFALRGPDLFHLRVMREVLLITPVATLLAYLWSWGDADRPYRWGLAICVIDVAFCGATFLHGGTATSLRHLYGIAININFIGLCICVAAPGVRDAYRHWIADIERVRSMDSATPDFDYALRAIDRDTRP